MKNYFGSYGTPGGSVWRKATFNGDAVRKDSLYTWNQVTKSTVPSLLVRSSLEDANVKFAKEDAFSRIRAGGVAAMALWQ